MVEIPDDTARDDAQWLRTFWMMDETLSPGAIDRAKRVADRLDPPKPPPTLVEQMVEANANLLRTRGEAMTDVLAVVRAAVEGQRSLTGSDTYNDTYNRAIDDVLDLLGGGSDA